MLQAQHPVDLHIVDAIISCYGQHKQCGILAHTTARATVWSGRSAAMGRAHHWGAAKVAIGCPWQLARYMRVLEGPA